MLLLPLPCDAGAVQERAELCHALLYAVVLSQEPLKPATLAGVLQLLGTLVARVKAEGGWLWLYVCVW